MIDVKLLELVRCPRCIAWALSVGKRGDRKIGILQKDGSAFKCPTCGLVYPSFKNSPAPEHEEGESPETPLPLDDLGILPRRGYLDLMPSILFGQNTRYLEEEFEHEIDHQHISLPLLGAKVRNDLLRKMLKPSKKDVALEVGCGNGKFCYWNRDLFGTVVGVDAAPLFAEEALEEVPLVRGDVRLLPFAPASFDKIFSIDLLEHLPEEGIALYFDELNRVLRPNGEIFIFSNTREMGRLAPVIRLEKKVARYFTDKGVFDFKRDELRKSDHIKAIRTYEELQAAVRNGGFRFEETVFWNGVFQGLVDNIIIKAGESLVRSGVRGKLARYTRKRQQPGTVKSRLSSGTTGLSTDWADGGGARLPESHYADTRSEIEREAEKVANDAEQNAAIDLAVRKSLKKSLSQKKSGPFLFFLRFLTLLMKLDILLFGRMRTGPFFILIRKTAAPIPGASWKQ